MLHKSTLKLAAALALAGSTAVTAQAQDAGALVDKLIKKGVLTDQEGEEVRAEMTRDFAQTNAGKINLSSSITELKLYGDFRYRWQYDNKQLQVASPDHENQRVKNRFRLRLSAEAALAGGFYAGMELESGQPSDTGNQVMQDGFDDYGIFIGRAYMGWKNDWLDLTIGKFKNPFYTTDMIWDPDINPQGALETIAFHKMPWVTGGSAGPTGDGKSLAPSSVHSVPPWELTLVAGQLIYDDNNEFNLKSDLNTDAYLFVEQLIAKWNFDSNTSITIAPAFYTYTAAHLSGFTNENPFSDANTIVGPTVSTTTTTSTVNTVQDTVSANGLTTTRVTTPTTVISVVTTQTNPDGTRRVLTTQTTTRPGAANTKLLTTVGGVPNSQTTTASTVASASVATPAVPANGSLAPVTGETRGLQILTAPGDISFKLGGLKTKLYWDFAYNFAGRERFNDIYQLRSGGTFGGTAPYNPRDGFAWLVGAQIGETKKKGDWQIFLNYRESGIASIDPNMNDSDFALSELNTRGFKLSLAYAISDCVVLDVKGYMAWNMDSSLRGGRATNSPAIADANSVNTVQIDLSIKF